MNYGKLYESINKNKFIDLTLILTDGINQEIHMNLHKIILYSSSIYFEKLLTVAKEANFNSISINVPNVYVSYDIIMSFYGQKTNIGNLPNWKYLLESFKCNDFFGLTNDLDLLKNLVVPAEGFELLLDVIDFVGYTNPMIKLLNKNLPPAYDLSKFPLALRERMLKVELSVRIITGASSGNINIYNGKTFELLRTLVGHSYNVFSVC
jgi:WD40 repeat protein